MAVFRFPNVTVDADTDQLIPIRDTDGKYYNVTAADLLSLSVDGALIPSITDDGTDVTIDANLAVTGTFTVSGDTIADIVNLPSITDDGTDVTVGANLGVTGTFSIDSTEVTATAAEINHAADVSARVQELTASGAVTAGKQSVELNHATVVVAATIADASLHQGLFVIKDTSASGTAAHTVTITTGTFNGTNKVATLNAKNEALVVYFDSAGNGTILENVGSVALSG